MRSPTARTLENLRKRGVITQVAEHYNPHARRRIDLFDSIDIVVLLPEERRVLGIQSTSGTNHSSRVTKAAASNKIKAWLQCGASFEVWSWSKRGPRGGIKRWTLRRTEFAFNREKNRVDYWKILCE